MVNYAGLSMLLGRLKLLVGIGARGMVSICLVVESYAGLELG